MGDGYYYDKRRKKWTCDVRYVHPDGRRLRERRDPPYNTKAAAKELARQIQEEFLAGGGPSVAFAKYSETFLAWSEINNKRSEYLSKKSILEQHLKPHFGSTALNAIRRAEVEAYKAAKSKGTADKAGLSPKTINNHLAVLSKMLREAHANDLLKAVPPIRPLKVGPQDFDFLDFEEAAKLVASAEDEWRPLILCGLDAGLRLGEILGLRGTDVRRGNLEIRHTYVRGQDDTPKSHKPRQVPLTKRLAAALPKGKGRLFPYEKGQTKWPLWRACEKAGLRRFGWHVLRHTFASHLVMRGASIVTVSQLLGHSDIRITMRYAHLTPDARADAIHLLEVAE